ncbi:hypothetical protein [Streptomyces umbrinus]|uniref:hypothetical protein n=1 Tax=Streptomyces umbrinus TaxID=67370 RepID=UPI00167818F1|nr:hypothetical protein [Streptomyces umbrinus]
MRLWSSWAGEILRERYWRDLLEKAQPVRSVSSALTGPGRQIRGFTDPFALNVHEAIDAGGASELPPPASLPLLPLYAGRRHDRWLSGVVKGVAEHGTGEPTSALAVLVGESSTGKTRACWEALSLLPSDWQLVYPLVPSPAEALIAGLDGIAPCTVLWLDEIHRFLGRDQGEQAAARLHEVLTDPRRGPLLVLGTTQPKLWLDLIRPRRDGDRRDRHAQARALLTGNHHRVPDAFDDEDLPELRSFATADPRLQEALEHAEQGQITQYLTGGRALVHRYETATALQRALIESAMDARRLGHDTALPRLLLEAALPIYLTHHQYDIVADGDIEHALAELSEPWHGTRGPLTPITVREPGRPLVSTDKVGLAEYLDQYGRKERRTKALSAGLWDALTNHAARESLTSLAESARNRGHLRLALRLLSAATDAGVSGAAPAALQLMEEEGMHDDVLLWCLPHAEAGDAAAMVRVAGLMEMTRPDEAVVWYERAAEAGYRYGWLYAGMLRQRAGQHLEAEACFHRAVDAGATRGHGALASLLEQMGRTEEAFAHLRQQAEVDGGYAVVETVALMRKRGDSGATILSWLLPRVAEEGRKEHMPIPWAWSALLQHLALDATLRRRLRGLLDSGAQDDAVRSELTAMLDLAEEILEGDHQKKGTSAAGALRRQNRLEEALALYQAEADAGRRDVAAHVAALHEQLGRPSEAVTWYRRAADEGDLDALRETARLMTLTVGPDETFAWLMSCADRHAEEDCPDQRSTVAELLHTAGRTNEALDWLRRASCAGDPYAWRQYAELLRSAGRTEDAQRMQRYGWEPDGEISEPWSAAPPTVQRIGHTRVDEA